MSAMARRERVQWREEGTEWFMEKAEGADGASAKKNEREVPMNSAESFWGVEYPWRRLPDATGRILSGRGRGEAKKLNITGQTCAANGCRRSGHAPIECFRFCSTSF